MTAVSAARRRGRPARPEPDGSRLRWPGAARRFALFGEVLWTGILVTATGLPILTLPAALVAGRRHLERYLRAEESGVGGFLRDWRRALPGGLVVAAAAVALAVVFAIDVAIAAAGGIPGAPVVLAVGVAGLVAVPVVLLLAVLGWGPDTGWLVAVRGVPRRVRADPAGPGLLVVAVGLTAVAAWQLPPLLVPALGCLVFAAVAVAERRAPRLAAVEEPPTR